MKLRLRFSKEDKQWVANYDGYPDLSWMADTASEAMTGLAALRLRQALGLDG